MERVYNFSAGPSMLPEAVLKQAAAEMLNYGDSGMSVMEMSHRSKVYEAIIEEAEAQLRSLMGIPDNYKVLFLQGGASTQFAMVPMNLIGKTGKMDIVMTGQWAKKAASEAAKFGEVNKVASSEDTVYNYIPELDPSKFSSDASYFHITSNNTIYGTRFTSLPKTNAPIVADMSSNILSEVINVSDYGLIYAGAQKNMGPAGVCVVIIREDLIGSGVLDGTPTMLQYSTHAENGSMYNTPPTYSIYICMLVYRWLKELGGIPAIQKINEEKAAILYDYLDESKLFRGTVVKKDRSLMNVPFVTDNDELNAQFIKEATAAGFVNLKGHRSVGGMRASIYNAMPTEGVVALVDFMKEFERKNG